MWNRSGHLLVAVFTAVGFLAAAVHLALGQPKPAPAGAAGNGAPAALPAAGKSSAFQAIEQRFLKEIQPVLAENCYACHGNGKSKGDLILDRFTTLASVQADRKTWQNVSDMLQQRVMPPKDRKQRPTTRQVDAISAWVEEAVNYYDPAAPRDPGRVTIRRLNRHEYNNTIRDLVGVDYSPAADFPADDTGYGFDNIADVLTMSPLLAEKYLAAAEQIMARAIVTESPHKRTIKRYEGTAMEATVGQAMRDGPGWFLTANGELTKSHPIPVTAEYEIRIRAAGDQAGPDPARMTISVDKALLKTFDVKEERAKPGTFTFRQRLGAGSRKFAIAFINNYVDEKNPDPGQRKRNLLIEKIEIEGPIDLPPPPPGEIQKKLLFVMPGTAVTELAAARRILEKFVTRAFRRPATTAEVDKLMGIFRLARAEGEKFEVAMRWAMNAVLVSPHFLFRIESDPPASAGPAVHAISDYELATRLSYFLWSSMPDEELMTLAAAGKLRLPAVLNAQLKRMLTNGRAEAFVANFAGQWLELRNLADVNPDPKRFPDFSWKLKQAMRKETELFFQNIIKEDRSILELLDADYTFVNERLAKHYGIRGVTGDDFRKVSLAGTNRGGVLTMASVLSVTAMPSRTSPVKRGKWIMEQILGTPPPPPPPDVPPLADRRKDAESASLRQRLEQHRADPNCAVCHSRLDPIGFSLENFDAIGAFREKDGAFPVDAKGELPSGQVLNGAGDLKKMILSRKKEFVTCLAEKMMTYALGRGIEPFDRPTIKEITDQVEKDNYRFSSLITGIVKSDAFQKRRGK